MKLWFVGIDPSSATCARHTSGQQESSLLCHPQEVSSVTYRKSPVSPEGSIQCQLKKVFCVTHRKSLMFPTTSILCHL